MKYFKFRIVLLASILFLLPSCKKIIEIDPPKDSLIQESIFENDEVATSAMTGIYRSMIANGFASGTNTSITAASGLSADELLSYSPALTEFYNNQLNALTSNLSTLYSSPYQTIYATNVLLEGLNAPNGTTLAVRSQLKGEALFTRAFAYFYLVNMFGSVPLHLTSDYRITRIASKSSIEQIYQQIITDLRVAEGLLKDSYITTERIRPNLASVQAMLARTYLYTQDWLNAEKYASLLISKTHMYSLVTLDAIFLKNSREAIWQLMPTTTSGNTNEGALYILTATPTNVSLNSSFVNTAFEANDNRRSAWVNSYTKPNTSEIYYYPFKYKIRVNTPVAEYSMVLRLAEQFLIRAEARAMQNKLTDAIKDLDIIRVRAGAVSDNIGVNLNNQFKTVEFSNPTISQQDLLVAIQKERRVELFSEWGHRWFDLKRTGQADAVLSLIKPNWQVTDVFYPIPQREIDLNTNITQN